MTDQLTTSLRGLADGLETGAVSPPPEVVWRAGTRRRWRRRGGVGIAIAAVAALFALVVAPAGSLATLPAGRDNGAGVTAYPQRIGHQWHVGTFHAGKGPVALLVQRFAEHGSGGTEDLGWFAVTSEGQQSHLPVVQTMPSLSPDGRWVGYQPEGSGDYVLEGATSGREVRFAQVGLLQAQMPSYWNPSSDRVFVPVSDSLSAGVVLGEDGTRVRVPSSPGGLPYGWMGDDLVALQPLGPQAATTGTMFGVQVWRPGGAWTFTGTTVAVPGFADAQGMDQFTGSVAPDGSRIAIVAPSTSGGIREVTSFVLGGATIPQPEVDGKVIQPLVTSGSKAEVSVPREDSTCPVTWMAGQPLAVFRGSSPGDAQGGLRLSRWLPSGHGQPVVVTEARAGVECMLVATSALEGHPTWSPFGTSDTTLAWWWREEVLGTLLATVALAVVLSRRRTRRRRQRPTSAALGRY